MVYYNLLNHNNPLFFIDLSAVLSFREKNKNNYLANSCDISLKALNSKAFPEGS